MTTIETLTDTQIQALRAEAREAGDTLQVVICEIALGDANWTDGGWLNDNATGFSPGELDELQAYTVDSAREECLRVIRDAEAQ